MIECNNLSSQALIHLRSHIVDNKKNLLIVVLKTQLINLGLGQTLLITESGPTKLLPSKLEARVRLHKCSLA